MLSQVYKANRELFARLYPTTLVFKDGSTISIRFNEPRQIIKYPLTYEELVNEKDKNSWQIRRRALKVNVVESDEDKVNFDARKYLRPRKR